MSDRPGPATEHPALGPPLLPHRGTGARLPILETPGVPDRGPDRRIAVLGALGAAALLGLALASLLLSPDVRRGTWLPLHLALAGAAGLAIAAVLPFFATSFSAAPPAPPVRRVAALGLIGTGALAAVVGYPAGLSGLAAAGAVVFAGGIVLVAWSAFGPLAHRRRRPTPAVIVAYGVALADVAVGVLLVAFSLAGWPPLAEQPALLRAAHAWLNLLGFVSLVVAGTILHLLPTVLGARIAPGRAGDLAIGGLAVGAPLVAAGMLTGVDAAARLGATGSLAGAIALTVVALRAVRARGRWTTDTGWHRFIIGCLASSVGWFGAAATAAAAPVLVSGADPAAWSLARVAGPLVAGWVVLAILGAATHLLPSIGPGSPERHARQRAWLGRGATTRLVALETGVALLAIGLPLDVPLLVTAGMVGLAAGGVPTAGLLAMAATTPDPATGSSRPG